MNIATSRALRFGTLGFPGIDSARKQVEIASGTEGKPMQMSEMEDRFKIHDLFARYMRSVDNWDEAELFACFTEDGVLETPILDGRFAGREGQHEFVEKGRKNGAGRQSRHLFTNLEVEID